MKTATAEESVPLGGYEASLDSALHLNRVKVAAAGGTEVRHGELPGALTDVPG